MPFFRHNFLHLIILCCLIFSRFLSAQVVFRELPNYKPNLNYHSFLEITPSRDVILLNGNWKVYPAGEDVAKKVTVNIPSVFEGEGEFVFERGFNLSEKDLNSSSFDLVFLGLNYRADISINNVIIYRHAGGEFPFRIELSRDILQSDSANILSVQLFYKLDSEITIPLKQRYLFSKNYGGIVHDVYIYKKPSINISNLKLKNSLNVNTNEAKLDIYSLLVNREVLVDNKLPDD